MIPLLLLLCLSIYSPYIIQAAPFNYKNIEAGKTLPSTVSSDDDAYDADDEQITDEDDDFYTDLEKNISFRTKLSRSMRSIKKHTALIISSLGLCTVGFMYWYKIWPFNTSLPATNSSDTTTETSANFAHETSAAQEPIKDPVPVNKEENRPSTIGLPVIQNNPTKENEFPKNITIEYIISKDIQDSDDNIAKAIEQTKKRIAELKNH